MIPDKLRRVLLALTAILWSLLQLYNIFFALFDLYQLLPLHLMFALSVTFLLKPLGTDRKNLDFIIDVILYILSLMTGMYLIAEYNRIISRVRFVSPVTTLDIVFAIITMALIIEASRRIAGIAIASIALFFIFYDIFGVYFPGALSHRIISIEELSEFMYLTHEGIFGVPIKVSAIYVFPFILLGAFLRLAKIDSYLLELSKATLGRFKGGIAHSAVLMSALMGMISGSAVAVSTTVGSITIPLMVKSGYDKIYAASIVALSGTGAQITPPIMGAAAFMIAELTATPYIYIAAIAALPAMLYYIPLFITNRITATRQGIGVVPGGLISVKKLIMRSYMLSPIILLVIALILGYTIPMACGIGILTSLAIYLTFAIKGGRLRTIPRQLLLTLEVAGRSATSVAIPCAAAGIIVGSLILTGLSLKFSSILISLSGGNLLFLLLLTAFICIILGMGMPTSAVYITVAIVIVPALITSGIPILAAHLFAFYFANFSMITPPVALASYAAAGIAGASIHKVGWRAFKIGIPLYFIPFLFTWHPEIILQGQSSSLSVFFNICRAIIVLVAMTLAINGYMRRELKVIERIILASAAILLLPTNILMNFAGLILAFICILMLMLRR